MTALDHVDLMLERHPQTGVKIVAVNVLLDSIGTAVKSTLAPAGEVQDGFAERLRGDGAGVHRHAADATALLHHQDGAAEFRRLDGGTAAGRTAADHNEVVGAHGRAG